MFHGDVEVSDVLHQSAAVASGLDPDAVVCSLEGTIVHDDMTNAAADVAAHRHAVPVLERAIRDQHIFRWAFFWIRLERNIVITHVNNAVANHDVAAASWIDTVRVWRIGGRSKWQGVHRQLTASPAHQTE